MAVEDLPTSTELHPDDQQIEAIRADLAKPLQERQRAYPWDAVWVLLESHDQWRANCHRAAAQRDAAYGELEAVAVDVRMLRDNVAAATARAEKAEAELERLQGQVATDVRTVDATLKAWAVADRTKLADALIDLREDFIHRIAEAEVRERHAFEDARKAEIGGQGRTGGGDAHRPAHL